MGLRSSRQKAREMVFLQELVEPGKIKTVIDRVYPLEEIVEPFDMLEKVIKKGLSL